MPSEKHSPRWRGRRVSTGLPVSRRDADVATRARWLTFYATLVRARIEAVMVATAPDEPDHWELLKELLPFLHSVGCWFGTDQTCHWLKEETGVEISEKSLRMALRNPNDAWSLLWRDLRGAVWLLVRVHRVSAADILWKVDFLEELRSREPQLSLGNLEQSQRVLATIRRARSVLEQRWFILEPATRESARSYIGLITARGADDF